MDSVIYRLHHVKEKYPPIWQLAQQTNEGKQTILTRGEKPTETIDTVQKFILNYKSGSAVPVRYSDNRKVPSSNHDIPFFIDQTKNYLEINCSIPKYLFGNNVLEAITPPGHKGYSVSLLSPYDHVDFWYKLIREVFYNLVHLIARQNFIDLDWDDLEVFTIDFAVNQWHTSKIEAVKYLRHMGGIHKRHQRKSATGRNIIYDDETIFFPGDLYSVKIYHKGSEFSKLQASKIVQFNKQRKKQAKLEGVDALLLSSNIEYAAENIQRLQEYADKVLRYEFRFRPGYMSYLFNRKINKHWSRHFSTFKKIYDYLEHDVERKKFLTSHKMVYVDQMGFVVDPQFAFERKYYVEDNVEVGYEGSGVWKTISREFNDKEYLFMRILRKHGIVDRGDLTKWLSFMERELGKVRQFRWKVSKVRDTMKEAKKDSDGKILYINNAMTKTPQYVRFSRTVMNFMVRELENFFNNFQIDTKDTYSQFVDKMDKHNLLIQDKLMTATATEAAALKLEYIHPRTQRALLEFNNLFSKFSPKTVKERYQKTTYHRLLGLHRKISGSKFQMASAEFGDVNKDFNKIYKGLHLELQQGYLSKFYNTAFVGHYKASL